MNVSVTMDINSALMERVAQVTYIIFRALAFILFVKGPVIKFASIRDMSVFIRISSWIGVITHLSCYIYTKMTDSWRP